MAAKDDNNINAAPGPVHRVQRKTSLPVCLLANSNLDTRNHCRTRAQRVCPDRPVCTARRVPSAYERLLSSGNIFTPTQTKASLFYCVSWRSSTFQTFREYKGGCSLLMQKYLQNRTMREASKFLLPPHITSARFVCTA